jgi:hypothetical protein
MPNTPNTYNHDAAKTSGAKPSPAQLQYLRTLAAQSGTSFGYPRTIAEASAEIARLKTLTCHTDRHLERDWARRETREIRETLAELPGRHAAVGDDEISGHGSSARWA